MLEPENHQETENGKFKHPKKKNTSAFGFQRISGGVDMMLGSKAFD